MLDLVAGHTEVDAVIYLGIGIQAAQAELFRSGPLHPDHGLDRMVAFHESQDRRYARAAADVSEAHGKPVLVATDLTYTDRAYGNAGPRGVVESRRVPFPSGHRAVRTLLHLCRYAEYRSRLGRRDG